MGEVATVAAIGGGILTSGITGLVTWKVSRNSTSVELVKVAAENHRLQHGHREEERRNRQATYHLFLDALVLVFQLLGTESTQAEHENLLKDYNHLLAGVLLFGPPSVRDGAHSVNAVYRRIWPAMAQQREEHPNKPEAAQWRDATTGLKEEFSQCASQLIGLMHEDVTRGIADDRA